MQFTKLEQDILNWFVKNNEDAAFVKQCALAVPKEREYTGCGFFLTLQIPKNAPTCSLRRGLVEPHIESESLVHGAGCILFLTEGYLDFLEVYSFGDEEFPEELNQYTLQISPISSK